MKVNAKVIKSIAQGRFIEMAHEDLTYTSPINDQVYEEAIAALTIMREIDAGKKRISIDLKREAA